MAVITQLDPIHVIGQAPYGTYVKRREILKTDEGTVAGLEFTLVLPNGETYPHKGRIVSGGSEFDPATQTIAVAVEFANPSYLLRPGLNVTLQSALR
jgi:multidrug efflux pump subunit AcrA (membrane-fusion protein)